MSIDLALAAKGRREPLAALVQQGHASLQLAQETGAALAEANWSVDDSHVLAHYLGLVATASARRRTRAASPRPAPWPKVTR